MNFIIIPAIFSLSGFENHIWFFCKCAHFSLNCIIYSRFLQKIHSR